VVVGVDSVSAKLSCTRGDREWYRSDDEPRPLT